MEWISQLKIGNNIEINMKILHLQAQIVQRDEIYAKSGTVIRKMILR
jgi:hypothetical protein